jgi:hypothetical protein
MVAALAIGACVSGAPPGFSHGSAWAFPLVGPLEGGLLITPVTINGKGPYLFVIDPDAVISAVDDRVAADLDQYVHTGPRLLDESDTTRPTRIIEVTSITLGTLTVSSRQVMVHPAGTFATDGRDVRGVLGRDVIADSLVFGFDRDAGMAYLATKAAFTPPASSVRVPYDHMKVDQKVSMGGVVARRIARVTVNGAATKLHLDLGAVPSQLATSKWKAARLAPVPYKATTIDELGNTRDVEKAGIANRVEAGAASAMGLMMIPYADKRWDERDIDGTLGLNFFTPYVVWADWDGRAFYLTPRDGETDELAARVARWDGLAVADCREPACASARLETIVEPADPAAGGAAGTAAAMPPPAPQEDGYPPPTLIVARDAGVANVGYELLLEAVGADGRPLGLPRLAATFPAGTREIRQRLSPAFASARFRVLDVSPFVRACPGTGGCVFELVEAR